MNKCKGAYHSGNDEPTYGWPDDGIPILCQSCYDECHSPGNFVNVGINGHRWDAEAFNRGESGIRNPTNQCDCCGAEGDICPTKTCPAPRGRI